MAPRAKKSTNKTPIFLQPVTSSANSSAGRGGELSAWRGTKTPEFSFLVSGDKTRGDKMGLVSTVDGNPSVRRKQDLFLFPPEAESVARNSWLDLLGRSNIDKSPLIPGDISVRRAANGKPRATDTEITPFDDGFLVKVDHVEDQTEEPTLGKRNRGSPFKTMDTEDQQGGVNKPKTKPLLHSLIIQDNTMVFDSDAEQQSLEMDEKELDNLNTLCFGPEMIDHYSNSINRGEKPYSLDLGRLITKIDKLKAKDSRCEFVCRFCGKTFEKPSALGGHTAKIHQGLSLKYRKRVAAAQNRRGERGRIQFLRQNIHEQIRD